MPKIHIKKRNLSINNNIKKPNNPKYVYPSGTGTVSVTGTSGSNVSSVSNLPSSSTLLSNVPIPNTTHKKVLTGNKRKDRTVDGWSKLKQKNSLFIRYNKGIKRDMILLCKEMKLKRPTDVCRALIKQRAETIRKSKSLNKEVLANSTTLR